MKVNPGMKTDTMNRCVGNFCC